MTYERLERVGLPWPCPDESHPGTEILRGTEFARGPRATLRCVAPTPSPEIASDEYPWLLVTGRDLQQFNAWTMRTHTPAYARTAVRITRAGDPANGTSVAALPRGRLPGGDNSGHAT